MTSRSRNILRILASSSGYTTVEKIAEATGAGVRTIHRDLENLERSLGLQGVRMERRRGLGIRLVDRLPEAVLSRGIASASAVESGQRPLLALMYLIIAGDWIKISELAHAFFVSDSTVSSDLGLLDSVLPEGLYLERRKGIGVRLVANEVTARLVFLASFPSLFPPYLLWGDDTQKVGNNSREERLVRLLGLRKHRDEDRGRIASTEESIGYRFSPASFSMVFNYLYLRRLRAVDELRADVSHRGTLPVPDLYRNAAARLIAGAESFAGEEEFLARVLASCETATVPETGITEYLGSLAPMVDEVVERALGQLESRETMWLHDDQFLLTYLRLTVAAAARRIDLGIAGWRDFGLRPFPDLAETPESAVLVNQFSDVIGVHIRDAAPAVVRRELAEASFALGAHIESFHSHLPATVRVKILCFEGLGLSRYIEAICRDTFPEGTSFDSRWEPDFARTGRADRYDLVISTFPLHLRGTQHLLLDGETSPEEIRRQVTGAIDGITPSGDELEREPLRHVALDVSLSTVMTVVETFFVEPRDPDRDLLEQATAALSCGGCDSELVLADLRRRESFGSVVFEDLGIRLLHCRTDGVPHPRAGAIQSRDEHDPTTLVLAAPTRAQQNETHVLSEVVIALAEEADLPPLLAAGTRAEIQSRLLNLFERRVG